MSGRQKRNAFAIIHFGANPVYLELELYFFKMLRQYTRNDILYLYSVNDTPPAFVEAIGPLVTATIPYDDRKITYDVSFKSEYTNFNTLRTCNFIFAYTLEKYNKICIIESDMVIMKNLDPIFELKAPAVLTYYIGDRNLKYNDPINNNPREVIDRCKDMGRINGGVMVIYPSMRLFDEYKSKIAEVVRRECKYPNETLFEYVNNSYYNLPVQYNLSHYHAKMFKLDDYRLSPNDIFVFHFNETKYKHIDIIKNPIDETGGNWLDIIKRDKKYEVKRIPIFHYKSSVFDRYRSVIEPLMIEASRPRVIAKEMSTSKVESKESLFKKELSTRVETNVIEPIIPKVATRVETNVKEPIIPKVATRVETKVIEPSTRVESKVESKKEPSPIPISVQSKTVKEPSPEKKLRCPKGTRRNRRTGICEPHVLAQSSKKIEPVVEQEAVIEQEPVVEQEAVIEKEPVDKKRPKCPKGSRRNNRTGLCKRYTKR